MSHWKFIQCGSGSNGHKSTIDACERRYPSVSLSLLLDPFSTRLCSQRGRRYICAHSERGRQRARDPKTKAGRRKKVATRGDAREMHSRSLCDVNFKKKEAHVQPRRLQSPNDSDVLVGWV